MLDQHRMFREKETFNIWRPDYCQYVQDAGSAEDVWEKETFTRSKAYYCHYVQDAGSAENVSGEGDIQYVQSRLLSLRVRSRCWISRECLGEGDIY